MLGVAALAGSALKLDFTLNLILPGTVTLLPNTGICGDNITLVVARHFDSYYEHLRVAALASNAL